jgi:hypothetical protein
VQELTEQALRYRNKEHQPCQFNTHTHTQIHGYGSCLFATSIPITLQRSKATSHKLWWKISNRETNAQLQELPESSLRVVLTGNTNSAAPILIYLNYLLYRSYLIE